MAKVNERRRGSFFCMPAAAGRFLRPRKDVPPDKNTKSMMRKSCIGLKPNTNAESWVPAGCRMGRRDKMWVLLLSLSACRQELFTREELVGPKSAT